MDENFGNLTRFNKDVISVGSIVISEMPINENIILQQRLDLSHGKPHINLDLYVEKIKKRNVSSMLKGFHTQELSTQI